MGFESWNIDTHIKNDGTFRAEYTEYLDDKNSIDIILEMNDEMEAYSVIVQTWADAMGQLHKMSDVRVNDAISMCELLYFVIGMDNIPTFAKQRITQIWNAVDRDTEKAQLIGSNNVEGFTVDVWRYETITTKRVRYEATAYDSFVTVRGYGDCLQAALADMPRNVHNTQRDHCAAMFAHLCIC